MNEVGPELPPAPAAVILVEKGGPMDYEAPRLEVAGSASELIQAYFGPHSDGDGYQFSQGLICDPREN